MMNTYPNLDETLVRILSGAEIAPLDLDDEREAIEAARRGYGAAYVTLLLAYAPLIRKMVASRYGRLADVTEDTRAALAAAVFYAIAEDFDPEQHDRLGSVLRGRIEEALHDNDPYHDVAAVTIPGRTLRRFRQILREADGDHDRGREIAPQAKMNPDRFTAIYNALKGGESRLDGMTETERAEAEGVAYVDPSAAYDALAYDENDRDLVAFVFSQIGDEDDLTEDETAVLRWAYGFETYGEPLRDDAVGHHLGMSRATAQRRRVAGLTKARRRLRA